MTLPRGATFETAATGKDLIRGNVADIEANVARLSEHRVAVTTTMDDLKALRIPSWDGGLGYPQWEAGVVAQTGLYKDLIRLYEGAEKALRNYAGQLTSAQTKAGDALEKWHKGQQTTRDAVKAFNTQVAVYNEALARAQCSTTPSIIPAHPGTFSDPGQRLRDEAQQDLDKARKDLETASREALVAMGSTDPFSETKWTFIKGKLKGAPVPESKYGSDPVKDGDLWKKYYGDYTDPKKRPVDKDGNYVSVSLIKGSYEDAMYQKTIGHKDVDLGGGLKGTAQGTFNFNKVEAGGEVSLDGKGLKVEGSAAYKLAEVKGDLGIKNDVGEASLSGNAYVGAEAKGSVQFGPKGAHAGGEIFAGAKAEAKAGIAVHGVGAEVKGEAWAGVGASADFDFGYKDGKFTVGGSAGAGLGIGGKVGGSFTIDAGEVMKSGKQVLDVISIWD